uniref:Uncharacterized protein n=1 Tax=Panagrolaimus davidi TaxID=227884 RepID=A0A914QZK9_9BILA
MLKVKGKSVELRRDLNIQCQTEELSTLMMEYDISLKYLSRSFNLTSVMEKEQLTRMAQRFEIIPQKNMEVEYTVAQPVAIAADIYIKYCDIALIKEAFAAIKSELCRKAAAETLVYMCTATLDLCDSSLAETRLAAIDSCSLIGETVEELDRPALDTSIHFIRQIFYIFRQHASENVFRPQHATFIINFLQRLSPCLIKLADTALRLELFFETDLLFYVQEFISLFEQTLKCLTEMPGDADRWLTTSFSSEKIDEGTSKIYEMSHR